MPNAIDIFTLQFVYHDGSTLSITDKSFKQAIRTVLNEELIKETPIKVLFPNSKKILYFDKQLFTSYIKGDIDQAELIESTQCQGLFRNTTKLLTNTQEEIEPGTLWIKRNNVLSLINDDEYITCDYVDTIFVEV